MQIREQSHPDLHRVTRIAELVDENSRPVAGLEPLLDAVLLSAHRGYWTMAGYEHVTCGYRTVDYAQSWVLVPEDEMTS